MADAPRYAGFIGFRPGCLGSNVFFICMASGSVRYFLESIYSPGDLSIGHACRCGVDGAWGSGLNRGCHCCLAGAIRSFGGCGCYGGGRDTDCHAVVRSEAHTSEPQSLMGISYAVLRLNKNKK